MARLLRWIGISLGSLAGLAIVAYAIIYIASERIVQRTYHVPAASISIPTDTASIAEGRRLATIRGCFAGCHGKQAEGAVMFNVPMIARFVAPNLTAAVHKYSDAELAAIVRNGLRPDGRSMVVMPSESFVRLTDEDLGRMIAFLRSLPVVEGPGPSVSLGPLGRVGVALGKFKSAAQLIADAVPPPAAVSEEAKAGRYLAETSCAQCHATSLAGTSNPDFTSPSLQVVAGYSAESFAALLRTGVALGGRQLKTMSPWARDHFSQFTDSEISALYAYLHSMQPPK